MRSDDNEDRAAILARRAALVAGALASVGVARRAPAEEPGRPAVAVDCPRRDPTASEIDEAKRLVTEAQDLALLGFPNLEKLQRAYALAPRPGLAALLMDAQMRAGDVDAAHQTGMHELSCGGTNPEIERRVLEIERTTGVVRLTVRDGRPREVAVDGKPLEPSRVERGIRLGAGLHTVRATTEQGRTTEHNVEVIAGHTAQIEVDGVPPLPCLSIVPPEPCLSIEGPNEDVRYAFHMGVVPAVTITGDDPRSVLGGGGVRYSLAVQVEKNLWFDGDIFAILTYGDETLLDTAGTVAELRWHPNGWFGFGAGFSAGLTAAYYDGVEDPMQEGMFGPVIVPASFLTGDALIELRLPLWFTATFDGKPAHDLRLGQITPHLIVSWGIPDRILKRAF